MSLKNTNLIPIGSITGFLPYRELPRYRRAAFALIIPSLTEGFGFVVAETSALAVPIIASNTGSIPEVASGRVLLFRQADSNDLAQKILLATKNKFDYIPPKSFSWNQTINKVEQLYKQLLNHENCNHH